MIATISTFEETGEQLEEGIRHVREEVVPSIREAAAGLKAGYWLVNRETGKRLSITIWDSADAASSSMPHVAASIKQLRERTGHMRPQRAPDQIERFEVFAEC